MTINGTVARGKQLGRTIGFPTANVEARAQTGDGADGVYAAYLFLEGKKYRCMVNIGCHPTLPEGGRTVEAHIFDFEGDIYGKAVRVETVAYLRPERKFASVEDLQRQLAQDRARAREILAK